MTGEEQKDGDRSLIAPLVDALAAVIDPLSDEEWAKVSAILHQWQDEDDRRAALAGPERGGEERE